MYESDFYAFAGLFHQHFLNLLCSVVMAKIEILHVDVFFGVLKVLHEKFELSLPGSYYFQSVAVRDASRSVAGQETGERLVFCFDEGVFLVSEQQVVHLTVGSAVEGIYELLVLFLGKRGLPQVEAYRKVQQESDDRQDGDYQYPGDFLGGIPIVKNDDDDGAYYKE